MTGKKSLRIVFMGTPEIAVTSLEAIVREGYDVAGVITAPDKPAGRGRKIQFSPVKQFALAKGLPLLQPTNLKDPLFLEQLKEIAPDVQVVVAFRMLPGSVWSLPPKGTFNMHASLLPQYRGAAPINWAVINGETSTGVTTFFLDKEIDTGRIIARSETDIYPDDTAGTLHDRLMILGAQLVAETLRMIEEDRVEPIDQQKLISHPTRLKKAPKIFREDCRINWDKTPVDICNLIRGLNPVPGAFTELNGVAPETFYMKIFHALPILQEHDLPVGKLFSDNKTYMKISCRDGFIDIKTMQAAGKTRMNTADFLRGYDFSGIEPLH
jgi:methionyl-tRNA formyltransferase